MNVLFLGAPGSGKGTQCKRLALSYRLPHISTGDIFREEIAKKSQIGEKVAEYVNGGRLVPDDLVVEVVSERLAQGDCSGGFFLDGFPRTVAQALALGAHLAREKREIDRVLYLELSEKDVVARLSSRRTCEKCGKIYNLVSQPPQAPGFCDVEGGALFQREDDSPETIKKRLKVFCETVEPLLAHYRNAGILETLDGNISVDEVTQTAAAVLGRVLSR